MAVYHPDKIVWVQVPYDKLAVETLIKEFDNPVEAINYGKVLGLLFNYKVSITLRFDRFERRFKEDEICGYFQLEVVQS